MKNEILHVFRNTPFGRETFLHSIYLAKKTGMHLKIYIPEHPQFLMYFYRDVVTVNLDSSFLRFSHTAKSHAKEIIQKEGVEASFLEPKRFTASTLPDIPTDFGFMTCPRTISDLTSKIGLGYIGPRVRGIIKNAPFPVLIPSPVFKEWKSVVVFFGGSKNAINALKLGMELETTARIPLILITFSENKPKSHYEGILREFDLMDSVSTKLHDWIFVEKGPFEEGLYLVPHDSLIVIGAYGHGLIRDVLFGSMMEKVQTVMPNSMVIAGPHLGEY